MKRIRGTFFLCALLAASAPAWAASATTTFSVASTITATCTLTANALNFGAAIPSPITSNIDVTTSVIATCSSGAAYTIALDQGTGPGRTWPARRMASGPSTMMYGLYADAGRTTVWGDGTSGTAIVNGTGTGVPQSHIVYGRIPAQVMPAGRYSDTISVTITF